MTSTIILPGIGGSADAHWQTCWERSTPGMTRFQPASWNTPVLENWLSALSAAVANAPEPPFLVAHSLACLLVAHWSARQPSAPLKGAFLVAVPDADGPAFPASAESFRGDPDVRLRFPSLVVASEDDPFDPFARGRLRAKVWGSGLIIAGRLGHISEDSALGEWQFGKRLFEAFQAGAGG